VIEHPNCATCKHFEPLADEIRKHVSFNGKCRHPMVVQDEERFWSLPLPLRDARSLVQNHVRTWMMAGSLSQQCPTYEPTPEAPNA